MLTLSLVFLVVSLLLGDVTSQDDGATTTCPYKECTCKEEIIDCQNRGLNEIPPLQKFTGNFTQLNFHNNSISYIGDDALPPRLFYLHFDHNPINNISESAFVGSSKTLKNISFSNATFDKLPRALKYLDNLNMLCIYHSTINSYTLNVVAELGMTVTDLTLQRVGLDEWPEWLAWFPFLRNLDLSDNPDIGSHPLPDNALDTFALKLTRLNLTNTGINNVTVLQSLKVLQLLDISNNRNSDHALLTFNLIPSSTTLEYIDVSNNSLTQLPRLEVLTNLTTAKLNNNNITKDTNAAFPTGLLNLYLGGNSFKKIPDAIKSMPQLQTLDIRRNSITKLDPHDFSINSSLQALYLNDNPIDVIHKHAFDNIQQLTYLDLDNTTLTRLPLALSSLGKLTHLDMRSNDKLLCTCDEKSAAIVISRLSKDSVNGQCNHVKMDEFVKFMEKQCP